ncbi:hypothetical protein D3C76_1519650 [compost metagenome]
MVHYRFGSTSYRIEVLNSAAAELTLRLDGQLLAQPILQLRDDGKPHQVIAQCKRNPVPIT